MEKTTLKNDFAGHPDKPVVLIVMGVSGSGKTTLAHALADALSFTCLDADDFHSDSNKAHMASGKPLTDDMRRPWVKAIRRYLEELSRQQKNCIIAFSGLRREHRDLLRIEGSQVVFLYLNGSRELIAERMQARSAHFMPASLLDSQFDALECPLGEPDVIAVDILPTIDEVLAAALSCLSPRLPFKPGDSKSVKGDSAAG